MIGEAYAVLSDPKKKERYDSGQDLEDEEGGFAEMNPNALFQMMFGNGFPCMFAQEFPGGSAGFSAGP